MKNNNPSTNRCSLPSKDANYSGLISFMRLPYRQLPIGADVCVWGIPFDSATSNRPGARFGPRSIRQASMIMTNDDLDYPFNFSIRDTLKMFDCGDAKLDYGHHAQVPDAIEAQSDILLQHAGQLVTFGGDHYVTYPLLKSLSKRHGRLALIQFDAHQDTWHDDNDRIDHGTFVGRAVKQKIIDPDHSIQIGIRTHAPDDYAIAIINGFEANNISAEEIARRIIQRVGDRPAYLTFDIDCLDPAFAPGTGTPVCGGLSTAKAQEILINLTELNWVGCDVVEVAPAYDHAEMTSLAGATIAISYLGLIAAKKRAQGD